MPLVWPASLPNRPLRDGHEVGDVNLVVRTTMDAGPPKVRRRFTAGFRPFAVEYALTRAQVTTLRDFFVNTTAGGSLAFEWFDPLTQATEDVRFTKPPAWSVIGGRLWRVRLEMEVLP